MEAAMKALTVCACAVVMWSVVPAWADDVFPEVQYISGSAALVGKTKGTLVLTPTGLRFNGSKGDSLLEIPLGIIKTVKSSVEEDPGSTGRKIMLGVFAGKKEEFVYLNTETSSAAEVIVFKVKKKTSEGTAAKIEFQMKKAAATTVKPVPEAVPAAADSAARDSTTGR
jgi:hypothetical protein